MTEIPRLNEKQQELCARYADPHYEWARMYMLKNKNPRCIDFMSIASHSLVVAAYHFDKTKASFPTYVRRIFVNMIHDEIRKLNRDKRIVDNPHEVHRYPTCYEEDFLEPLIVEEEHKIVMAACRRLPNRYRQVISLRYTHGKTLLETAKELKVTRERVRQIQLRAIALLQGILKGN